MHKYKQDRVHFYSKEDLAAGHELSKGEHILRSETKANYTDINDVLELYNLKKYLDYGIYLKSWKQEEIDNFNRNAIKYGKIVGQFFSIINDNNVIDFFEQTQPGYIHSFCEIVSNHKVFKKISNNNFREILKKEPYLIREFLTHKVLVEHYNIEFKDFLLSYPKSAEILMSFYDVKDDFQTNQKYIPKSLTIADKEKIISNYLESTETNLNYIRLIENTKNRDDFKISDRTRLKARRKHKIETELVFANKGGFTYGVSINFQENASKIKDVYIDDKHVFHYSYSLDFIKINNDPYFLFQNFWYLFEFVDNQYRINLLSKKSKMILYERILGIHSQNEYRIGASFQLSEITSQGQICCYNEIISNLNTSLESILHFAFTTAFQERYVFASNARFLIPTSTNSYFEKVRLLAPEFESILKQFKLYVEDGGIDFELLQISSSPTSIKDIPSLNKSKYVYFNLENKEMVCCSDLFFSDQTNLAHVETFKEKKYSTFFELISRERVKFSNYEEHQKSQLKYLVSKGFIKLNDEGIIEITDSKRILIFKDLYDNEFASFYHYDVEFQNELMQMKIENIVFFESSLFSRTEQSYFNYFLNKSEFTNGLDLRNSYLHGTQANPEETQRHKSAYFTYLKLLILAMLKIDNDLLISIANKNDTK